MEIKEYFKEHKDLLLHDYYLFDILEGNLLKYLQKKMHQQLTGKSAALSMQRAVPINVLRKITDKLSKLYSKPVKRTVSDPGDAKLIEYYENEKDVNVNFSDANFNFNAYKKACIEIYESDKEEDNPLYLRSLPGHEYLPYASNPVNDMQMTEMIKIFANHEKDYDENTVLFVYSDDKFMAINKNGEIQNALMPETGGENTFGIIPFSYIQRSRNLLVPIPDSDLFQMSLLIPVLMSDLTFASMYLSHPQIYGIDLDIEDLKKSPDSLWNIKSQIGENGESAKPELNVLKADPNIVDQLTLVKETLGMWLQTRNIKPGTVGKLTAENAASGISLVIQEADTTEDRDIQKKYFAQMEKDFWYRLATIHNNLVEEGRIKGLAKFSDPEKLNVSVEYSPMTPIESKTEQIDRLTKEILAGINSKEHALQEYRPDLDDEVRDEILKEAAISIVVEKESNGDEAPENKD